MTRNSETYLGGALVTAAVILNFVLMGLPVVFLNTGLIIAFLVWASSEPQGETRRSTILPLFGIGIIFLFFHFLEEYLTGFQTRFPGLFGVEWSGRQFTALNLIWLSVFLLALYGVYRNIRLAFVIVWFFALLAGIGNGLFHPLISLFQGAYFPGLVSSFFLLIIGIMLIRQLTERRD